MSVPGSLHHSERSTIATIEAATGPATTSGMLALRGATQWIHERVEAAFNLDSVLAQPGEYVRLLWLLHRFYWPVEERLAAFASDIPGLDFAARRKARWLAEDLRVLDPEPSLRDGRRSPHHLPNVESLAAALGCMYVLEGATLGGAIISRLLEKRLGVSPERGGRFFASYGDQRSRRWREFGQVVDDFVEGGGDRTRLIGAAIETFSTMEVLLCRD